MAGDFGLSITSAYAKFFHRLHGFGGTTPQDLVLAANARTTLISEGDKLIPAELQGKYTVALKRLGGETGSNSAKRHKPIYERDLQRTERQAIEEAANALSALWKVRRSTKL